MKRTLRQILSDAWKIFLVDIKSAKWAVIVIIAYFVFLNKIFYSICPMVLFTGYPCPGCGMTRAAFRVLHLDFAGAWDIHPFIFPVIFLAVFFCVDRYLMGRKRERVVKWFMIVTGAGMILFYIWRMVYEFPGEPPMSYYYNNFLSRIQMLLFSLQINL